MNTYILLVNYTQKGVEGVKDSPKRVDAFRELCRKMGAEMKSFYLTLGRCDVVVTVEAPDDAALAKLILATASMGNVRTETMRAFTEQEYRSIVAALP